DAWCPISFVRIDESEVRSLQSTLTSSSDDRPASPTCRRIRCVGIKAAQEAARLFSRTTVVVPDTKIYRQFRRNLVVVLYKEPIREKSQGRVDRLVAVKGKLRAACDQAGDGPTLVEIVSVCCLVTAEVEVTTDVKVGGVVQL